VTLGMMVMAWGVVLADAPTDSTTTMASTEIYYRMAENRYALHDTRLESCYLCHAGTVGGAVTGMNAYGEDLLTQLKLSVPTAAYGNSKVDVTSAVTITNALKAIDTVKSGGDTTANSVKLWALTFPGNSGDKWESEQTPPSLALGPHGGYGNTPDQCSICHRTHTAQAPKLLKQDQQALCYTCHGTGGANTDVKDGAGPGGAGLRGGGFVNTLMDTAMTGTPVPAVATSSHTVDGTSGTMWGSGTYTSTVIAGKAGVTLECGNCHDPHMPTWSPDGGTTLYTQYRMLSGSPRESGAIGENGQARYWYLSIPEDQTKHGVVMSYTQTYISSTHEVQDNRPDTSYQTTDRVGEFCALCHTRYMTGTIVVNSADSHASTTGFTSSGDAVFKFQHATRESSCSTCHVSPPTGMQPPADSTHSNAWSRPRCLDCHVSHGTSAAMGSNSRAISWPGSVVPGGSGQPTEGNNRSSLLRLNNRGVCTQCHEK